VGDIVTFAGFWFCGSSRTIDPIHDEYGIIFILI
jgi:hypothetical protein